MKRILLLSLLALSLNGFSQQQMVVSAYPVNSLPEITGVSGAAVDPGAITVGQVLQFRLPVYNNDLARVVVAGAYKLQIDLGPAITVDAASFSRSAALSEYFKWEAVQTDGRVVLTGTVIKDIPSNFAAFAVFNFQCVKAARTTVTMEWVSTGDVHSKSDPKIVSSIILKAGTGKF